MKKQKGSDMPQTMQARYSQPGDLGETNAIPRCEEFDLEPVTSRTRIGSWGDEQTFRVPKKGNCP
jgi:hypothetical protein